MSMRRLTLNRWKGRFCAQCKEAGATAPHPSADGSAGRAFRVPKTSREVCRTDRNKRISVYPGVPFCCPFRGGSYWQQVTQQTKLG